MWHCGKRKDVPCILREFLGNNFNCVSGLRTSKPKKTLKTFSKNPSF